MANMLALAPFIFLIIPANLIFAVVGQSFPSLCGNNSYDTTNTIYKANLDQLLSSLPMSIDSSSGFYSGSVGQIPNRVNAMALCRGDIEFDACQTCVQNASNTLPQFCPNTKRVIVWYDECMLRYASEEIAGILMTSPYWWKRSRVQAQNSGRSQEVLMNLLEDLRSEAANSSSAKKVAAGRRADPAIQTVYALVQCTPDLHPDDCSKCLINATQRLLEICNGMTGCHVFLPSCVLRHETYLFYDESKLESLVSPTPELAPVVRPLPDEPQSLPKGKTGVNITRIIIPAVVSIIGCLMIVVFISIWLWRRRKNRYIEIPEVEKVINTSEPPHPSNPNEEEINTPEPPQNHSYSSRQEISILETPQSSSNPTREEIRTEPPENPSNTNGPSNGDAEEVISAAKSIHNPSTPIEKLQTIGENSTLESLPNLWKPIGQLETVEDINIANSLQYKYSDIISATGDFANKLGKGAFGTVYKGVSQDGREIAVKRLSMDSTQGDKEFKNEVSCLSQLQHRNLVKLLGFSMHESERLLVYEFVPGGSLNRHIFDPSSKSLDWIERYKIIQGIAKGLVYLHEDSPVTMIHLDLKASNVLLDKEMNPKIADFGLARLFGDDKTHGSTKNKAGTSGYMPPEYTRDGRFSFKFDVFSFGVLVLEIISGRRRNCMTSEEDAMDLVSYALKKWREEKKQDIVNSSLKSSSSGSMDDISKCINIALLCVEEKVADRPTMSEVCTNLSSLKTTTLNHPSEATYNYWLDPRNSIKVSIQPQDPDASKNTFTKDDELSGR